MAGRRADARVNICLETHIKHVPRLCSTVDDYSTLRTVAKAILKLMRAGSKIQGLRYKRHDAFIWHSEFGIRNLPSIQSGVASRFAGSAAALHTGASYTDHRLDHARLGFQPAGELGDHVVEAGLVGDPR